MDMVDRASLNSGTRLHCPVVLGDADELGAWKNPIVKLHQKNRTYWKSDPVPISIISSIQYKYAIHIPKTALTYIEFEDLMELMLETIARYYISKKREEGSSHELPNNFPSNLLLNTLEDYKQEFLPLDTKDQMHTAIITLIQHNAFSDEI
ncbi:unnamed protein product [Rhizophagus irregularis]|nr:unnamed protein product [Rhizophagus irregularis]